MLVWKVFSIGVLAYFHTQTISFREGIPVNPSTIRIKLHHLPGIPGLADVEWDLKIKVKPEKKDELVGRVRANPTKKRWKVDGG